MKTQPIKGYKVFNPDFTCRDIKFKVGETFEVSLPLKICKHGIHFCTKASHCFSYYDFKPDNVVCEVEALGEVVNHDEDSKMATNKLKVVRQLTWAEVLEVANEGSSNTGHSNTGHSNTGHSNTGDRNTGHSNTGHSNTGHRNTGDRNTGDRNTGDSNTGHSNTGYSNTGHSNTGHRNTGCWNTGHSNTGHSNTGDRNTGVFCTGEPETIKFFNKESNWTEEKFMKSKAWDLLCQVNTKLWIPQDKMAEDEKSANRGWKTTGGFYRDIPYKEAFQDRWNNWSESNRKSFKDLPNFDAVIFEEITGVKI